MTALEANLTDITSPLPQEPATGFTALGLVPALLKALEARDYTEPTAIQARAIPALLEGRDVIGLAQTGTGKTAAFSLPVLQQLDLARAEVQVLMLAPTRELAMQVTAALQAYSAKLGRVEVLTVYGGAPIHRQLQRLARGVHIVVGTPGRVMDCMRRGALKLDAVRTVVLDEADEMLRMGFIDDISWILDHTPDTRQMALFSATMPRAIAHVAKTYLTDPVTVTVERETMTVANTVQNVVIVNAFDKMNALTRILEAADSQAVLVFARTKVDCGNLAEALQDSGFAAEPLHGDMSQALRQEVVRRLKSGKTKLVVATDVAARGLDIDHITHVIQIDAPNDPDTYVHRIGRTGRAGRDGTAILFLTPRERAKQRNIEYHTRQKMTPMALPTNADLTAVRRARFASALDGAIAGDDAAVYRDVVRELVDAGNHDLETLAAGLAAMACRDLPLSAHGVEPRTFDAWQSHTRPAPRANDRRDDYARRDQQDRRDRGRRPSHHELADERPRRPAGGRNDWVRLYVSLGRRAKLRPQDLVGAIANEAGVPGSTVGPIEIGAKFSFFGVAPEAVDQVLQRMAQTVIRGRKATVRLARPVPAPELGAGGEGARRPGGAHTRRDQPHRK